MKNSQDDKLINNQFLFKDTIFNEIDIENIEKYLEVSFDRLGGSYMLDELNTMNLLNNNALSKNLKDESANSNNNKEQSLSHNNKVSDHHHSIPPNISVIHSKLFENVDSATLNKQNSNPKNEKIPNLANLSHGNNNQSEENLLKIKPINSEYLIGIDDIEDQIKPHTIEKSTPNLNLEQILKSSMLQHPGPDSEPSNLHGEVDRILKDLEMNIDEQSSPIVHSKGKVNGNNTNTSNVNWSYMSHLLAQLKYEDMVENSLGISLSEYLQPIYAHQAKQQGHNLHSTPFERPSQAQRGHEEPIKIIHESAYETEQYSVTNFTIREEIVQTSNLSTKKKNPDRKNMQNSKQKTSSVNNTVEQDPPAQPLKEEHKQSESTIPAPTNEVNQSSMPGIIPDSNVINSKDKASEPLKNHPEITKNNNSEQSKSQPEVIIKKDLKNKKSSACMIF